METQGMKGNVCGMTHKQSMKLFKRFFKRKQKKRKRGDKESLKQNALVPTLKCRIP